MTTYINVLIPTKTYISMEGNDVVTIGTLLALQDNNAWYMMRMEDSTQTDILIKAYPDMKDIKLLDSSTMFNGVKQK